MQSLFFKIFLWFWLAMALIGLALLLVAVTTSSEPVVPPQRGLITDALADHAHEAALVYERSGAKSLAAHLARLERRGHIRAFLFDANGQELSGRRMPAGVQDLAKQVITTGEAQFLLSGRYILGGQDAVLGPGRRYVLVAAMERGLLGATYVPRSTRALRIVAVLLTAGLVCYGLARHLTAPVGRMRQAAQRLAAGDLTARVGPAVGRRRDELADLGRDFDRMAERIESLLMAQRRLLGDISHELRSPLARLNLALELARRNASPQSGAALDRIEREATRLNALIGQLLTLARLESGDAPHYEEEIDLARMVREVAADADFEAQSRGCHVAVTAAPCATRGTPDLLRSAIENVVRNAVRYTEENTTVDIDLHPEPATGEAVLRVRDRGAGVPADALPDLFRPFYRVADDRDRQSGGTGLGLAITDRAVRSHGGTVRAANAPDGGLIVEIRLPPASSAGRSTEP